MPILFLLFIVIPLIEIALFVQVGDEIGALPTVALVVFTAAVGVLLIRWQGVATLLRARTRMAEGQLPAREMIEGVMLAVAGAFLLTPGFFTDTLGFLLLIPFSRRALIHLLGDKIKVQTAAGNGPRGGFTPGDDEHTFEGEYRRTDDAQQERDSLPKK